MQVRMSAAPHPCQRRMRSRRARCAAGQKLWAARPHQVDTPAGSRHDARARRRVTPAPSAASPWRQQRARGAAPFLGEDVVRRDRASLHAWAGVRLGGVCTPLGLGACNRPCAPCQQPRGACRSAALRALSPGGGRRPGTLRPWRPRPGHLREGMGRGGGAGAGTAAPRASPRTRTNARRHAAHLLPGAAAAAGTGWLEAQWRRHQPTTSTRRRLRGLGTCG